MILHYIHVIFFAFALLAIYLFITHPSIFFIFHQVLPKPFKFINNGLQTNESPVNELNFPSFLSLCLCIRFRPLLGKVSKQFLYKYQCQCILIISVIWLRMIRLKYTVIVLILTWEFRWCKMKANRETNILFLLFTLLTLYPDMSPEWFRWLRASYNSLWLL